MPVFKGIQNVSGHKSAYRRVFIHGNVLVMVALLVETSDGGGCRERGTLTSPKEGPDNWLALFTGRSPVCLASHQVPGLRTLFQSMFWKRLATGRCNEIVGLKNRRLLHCLRVFSSGYVIVFVSESMDESLSVCLPRSRAHRFKWKSHIALTIFVLFCLF